jgi:hypothetical protein
MIHVDVSFVIYLSFKQKYCILCTPFFFHGIILDGPGTPKKIEVFIKKGVAV